MTAKAVPLKRKPHKHFINLSAEVVGRSEEDRPCYACDHTIEKGKYYAAGTIETCDDPGTEHTMLWCWDCFVKIGKAARYKKGDPLA